MKEPARITLLVLAAIAAALAASTAALADGHAGRCDKSAIVFTRFADDGVPNLFATDSCGGPATQITTTGGHRADLSPNGRMLAYDSVPDGQESTDVFVSASDGSAVRDVTNSPTTSDIQPDFSPDGQSVAYSSGPAGARGARIVVLNLRAGKTQAITQSVPGTEAFDPSWSPSGRWIVFDTFDFAAGTSYLWIVRSDGQDLQRITDDAADACQPDWGPDDLIAYAGGCDQLQSHLYIRDPLGLRVRQLTTDPDGGSSQLPAFSPDGSSLTFSKFDAFFDDGDVWRLDLATGLQTDLVSGPTFDFWSVWGHARH
jgi:Tol biopolymer transport system component